MYLRKQAHYRALALYDECGSVTKTITQLGYPARRQTLYNWIIRRKHLPPERSTFHGVNTPEHPRHPPLDLKLNALHRCFELGENVQSVSDEIGYSTASIYQWRRKYIQEGRAALMKPSRDRERGALKEGTPGTNEEISQLKAQVQNMQLEIDILKATLDVLKKDPGINTKTLSNREKAVIVDALRGNYSLSLLLEALNFPKSSYYHQFHRKSFQEKYRNVSNRIREIFVENYSCYGYRRITAALNRDGLILSEKVVRHIMRENQLIVKCRKMRKYSSYQGEISPAVANVVARNFKSEKPNQKWLTDITEFSIPAGKVYLSPMIDCFDGMPVSWKISTSPSAQLVNTMLDDAIATLPDTAHPLVHTDRGRHYRWPGWIDRMNRAQLVRSMSKKGCSPDNSACEGFFGRMKNQMFYHKSWLGYTLSEFIHEVNRYMMWYRDKRIKLSLGAMSPIEFRKGLGLVS
jgi:transposase InsO family protein/transposase-like protein